MIGRLGPRGRRWVRLGLCFAFAALCADASIAHLGLLPPRVTPRQIDVATAATRIAVDRPRSLLGDANATEYDYETIHARTVLLATLISSRGTMAHVARNAGLKRRDIAASTPVTSGVQTVFTEPDSERRAADIAATKHPYRLEVRPDPALPLIDVYALGPTVAAAQRLADAVAPGTRDFLRELALRRGADPADQVALAQLGPARGGIVNPGTKLQIAALTFLLAFAVSCALAFCGPRWLRRLAGRRPPARAPASLPRRAAQAAGDWPRTTRVLPWLVAVLMAVVWLVPFNDIMLDVALPIDLYLDRLVLPAIIAVWLLGVSAGGADAPRLRMTPMHAALGVVVAVAGLSLVLDARLINQTLEFDLAIKKLGLLLSFVSLFVIVASVVRRTEVRAFLTYTLLLALACAVGTIVEYRFEYNVFYALADAGLPGMFHIGDVHSAAIDEIGRRDVRGPAQASLEVVAMLSMALPIALVRLMQVRELRSRLLYGLAAAVLLAAIVSTYRKSAFLAPISVGLTLAYFRRRELIKLAPVGVALVLVVQVLSPGALTAVAGQLDRNRLGVTTVSDRTADYDAIRPDVFSHLPFGRGYGSYDPSTYRILDMELLRQLIEVGVIGLLAYVAMALTVVGMARRPIRAGGPAAPLALAAAAAAVCFLVVSTLFDVMSFPHVPYIFLWLAALLAVVCEPRPAAAAAPPARAAAPPPAVAASLPVARERAWSS